MPADAHACFGVDVSSQVSKRQFAARRFGHVEGRLAGRDVSRGHQEMDVGFGGQAEFRRQIDSPQPTILPAERSMTVPMSLPLR